jgi:glutamyl/glutaminyl-tRNA synthetase
MVLRLEDTDQTRLVPGAAAALESMLKWAGIQIDEGPTVGGAHGPYTQSARLSLYKKHANALVASGDAYPCFCTKERLAAVRQLGARTNRLTAYDGACRRLEPAAVQSKLEEGLSHTLRLKVPQEESSTVDDLVYVIPPPPPPHPHPPLPPPPRTICEWRPYHLTCAEAERPRMDRCVAVMVCNHSQHIP